MPKPKKIGKDAIGKTKGVGFIRTRKEAEEYAEYKRRKAEEEKKKKKEKKFGSEKMPEPKEPTAEQLAKQKAEVLADIARRKAEEEGKTVHVDEHFRSPPSAGEKEHKEEEETEEEEEEEKETRR